MTRMGWMMVLAVAGVTPVMAQDELTFSGRTWTTSAPDAVVEEYLGREALRVRNGAVVLSGLDFENGVIEYDVATTGHRSFIGVAFRLRRVPRVEYEHFYVRPHQAGRFDATQYTPEVNGVAAWQLYPEYNAPVDLPSGEWIHVRIVVSGRRMEAWVGDAAEPVQVVEDLRLDVAPGAVALTSNFPEAGSLDIHPTAFSNFRITLSQSAAPAAEAPRPDPNPGLITAWALSEAVPGQAGQVTALDADHLAALSWEVVPTDAAGRVNVAQYRAFPPGARQGRVFARVRIHADRARDVPMGFGFSDRGSVFLNGRLLFTGDNTYLSRSGRYLGVMTSDNDVLQLPLAAGDNELVFVVTEAFGGWGFVARLGDAGGIRVTAHAAEGEDALAHMRWAIEQYPIVLLGEGNHLAGEPHQVLRRILSDDRIMERLDVIIVEFATATYQDVLDAFIRGEEVPIDELSAVWRNTSTSPIAPWDSPLYLAFLETIRDANRRLPSDRKVRVIAGDPPVDWPSIRTGDDYRRAARPRDPYVARIAMEQAFGLGKRVLVVYGGGHLMRPSMGPGDGRNPITSYILAEHPGTAWVVEFMWPTRTGLAHRADELVMGQVYRTADHWSGSPAAPLLFPGTRSLVTDPETGEQSWQEVPLYEGLTVSDIFDALVYLGLEDQWTTVPPDLDPERDAAFLAELERRRALRFGG